MRKNTEASSSSHRTPVERAYYESLIFRDRWNVGRLYASNMYESQNYTKKIKHLARERKINLYQMDCQMEDMRRKWIDFEIEKENGKYLEPHLTAQKVHTSKKQVVPDERKPSVIVPPPLYATNNKSEKSQSEKQTKSKQRTSLYLPKLNRRILRDIPRKSLIAFAEDMESIRSFDDVTITEVQDANQSIEGLPMMCNTQDLLIHRNRAQSLPPVSFTHIMNDYNTRLRSRSIGPILLNESKSLSRDLKTSRGKYDDYITEKDFESTTVKFIPRCLTAQPVSLNNIL